MSVRDLIPWSRASRSSMPAAAREDTNPFLTLHREMNRLFDDVFTGLGAGWPTAPVGQLAWPKVEMTETDGALRVSAELPGLEEKDVELVIDDDVLKIRGEKRAETMDKDRAYSERSYGRFERVIALPYAVEEDKAEAAFKNGVLTVTLPRSAEAQERGRRIAIGSAKKEGTAH